LAKSLGTLGDLFPEERIQCAVRGCSNLLRFPGDKTPLPPEPPDPRRPEGMCDSCFAVLLTLSPSPIPCATPGCSGTWMWSTVQQLEARIQGNPQPPKRTCDACRTRRQELQDRQVPCRMRGCQNSVAWSAEEQWRDGTDNAPSRLCDACFEKLRTLNDKDVPCRIHGCTSTWTWTRFHQLEQSLAGKDAATPPRRMCRSCAERVHDLTDAELPCKIKGCAQTWLFTAFAQLEFLLTHGADEPVPPRMCPACFAFFNGAQDRPIPCRSRGCPHTWTYTRQMQLYDHVAGRKQPTSHLCQVCAAKIKATPDRQVPCSVSGCRNSWTYLAAEQVRDQCQGRNSPPSRRCASCEEFLAKNPIQTLICSRCGQQYPWSGYEQLLCHLGTFAAPTRCASCAEQELSLQRPAESPIHRHHHLVVRMPAGGHWNADATIAPWPPHLTADVLAAAEAADLRIVALGDDLTCSAESRDAAWPTLLEKRLNEEFQGKLRVVVVNSGMPKTTSRQALVRLPRDVEPFAPHLIIFSLAFGDAFLELDPHEARWRPLIAADAAVAATEQLCRKLQRSGARLLYWTTNPILPMDRVEIAPEGERNAWAEAQEASHNQILAHTLHVCSTHAIPVLDLRSRFEVNGRKSARKWMSDWYSHNTAGAQNIAVWMAEHILREKLLPLPQ